MLIAILMAGIAALVVLVLSMYWDKEKQRKEYQELDRRYQHNLKQIVKMREEYDKSKAVMGTQFNEENFVHAMALVQRLGSMIPHIRKN